MVDVDPGAQDACRAALADALPADALVLEAARMANYRFDRASDPEAGTPVALVRPETTEQVQEWDNSDYCVAGPITDNRDGTITAKMGKKTASDLLAELEAAYDRG